MSLDPRMSLTAMVAELQSQVMTLAARVQVLEARNAPSITVRPETVIIGPPAQTLRAGPTMAAIVAQTAAAHGLTAEDLRGRRKDQAAVVARAEAVWLMRREGFTLRRIGIFLDGRDHASIRHLEAKEAARRKRVSA